MKTYDRIEDICNLIKLFCLSVAISFFIYIYYKLPYENMIAFIFLGLIAYSYVLNSFIKYLPIYTLLHLLMFAPGFLLSMSTWGLVSSTIMAAVITIIDFCYWFIERDKKTWTIPMAFLLVFVVVFIYADGQSNDSLSNAAYYLGQIFVIASLSEMYLNNIHYLPSEGNDTLFNPKKSVLKRNNLYIIIILGVILIFNCIIRLGFLERLLTFLLSNVGKLIQFLLSLLFHGDNDIEELAPPEAEDVDFPPPDQPSLLALIISFILITLAILLIIYVIYRVLSYLIAQIKAHNLRKFKKKPDLDDDVVEISEDLEVKKRQRRSMFKFGTDLRERIRKRYLQEIKHQMKHGYQNKDSDTPNERSMDLLDRNQTDIKDLTSSYNVARYSDHPITSKDWNHIK